MEEKIVTKTFINSGPEFLKSVQQGAPTGLGQTNLVCYCNLAN